MRFDRGRGGRGGSGGRFRSRRPRYDLPKPVKVGDEYEVEIKEVGSKGDGIARIKNFVVFVTGAKMGDKIKIKITDVRGRFATAEKVGAAEAGAVEAAEEPAEAKEEAADDVEGEPMEEEKEVEAVEEEAPSETEETEEAPEEAAQEDVEEEAPAEEEPAAEEEDDTEEAAE